jgi:hypothetical protein
MWFISLHFLDQEGSYKKSSFKFVLLESSLVGDLPLYICIQYISVLWKLISRMVCIVRDEHSIMAEAQTLSTINYKIIHVQRKSTNIYHRQKLPSVSHHKARHAAAPIIASVYTKRQSKRSSSINIEHYGAKIIC